MVLSNASCFIHGEVIGFQVLLDSLHPRFHVVRGRAGGLFQFSKGEAVKIFLTSVSSQIRAMWLNSVAVLQLKLH